MRHTDQQDKGPSEGQAKAWVERRAKLFEAGEYPDKGVHVSEADLAAIANAFSEPVPVLIEHARSPFELGFLTNVEADGTELFGTLRLSREANELVESSEARSLSLGLSPDLRTIKEVSLVRNPRIAGARLFGKEQAAWHVTAQPDPTATKWLQDGLITPHQLPFAERLLRIQGQFSGNPEEDSFSSLFAKFVESGAASPLLQEWAKAEPNDTTPLGSEEAEFYRIHFPGLSLDEIAKRKV